MLDRIHWLGHASFRINGPPHADGPVIYIDPWNLPDDPPTADLILVSHDHYDHCSPADIALIRSPRTVIIANPRAAKYLGADVQVLRPWQSAASLGEVSVRAVPAYTLTHARHDRTYEGLGFVISWRRQDIYFAGDTDLVPEMERIRCDVALLPVGGVFTMGWEEATQAARLLMPGVAIPMHYGREIPGSQDDGRRFCQAVNSGVQVVELPVENERFRVLHP